MSKFVTISSASHLFKAAALAESLALHGACLDVWLTNPLQVKATFKLPVSCTLRSLEDLDANRLALLHKKYGSNSDAFRWSLKSLVLEKALLEGADSAVYLDNDLYFLQSPASLVETFKQYAILLTPHFYPSNPRMKGAHWFEANYQVGIFNAGFIGVRNDALPFLNWWFDCCAYSVRKSYFRGLFDDQKYLDLVPTLFEAVYIHPSPTWNFAAWNDWTPAFHVSNETLMIAENPVVFVHFATLSLERFSVPAHPANFVYQRYLSHLQSFDNKVLSLKEAYFSRRNILNFLRYLHWRLLTTFQD